MKKKYIYNSNVSSPSESPLNFNETHFIVTHTQFTIFHTKMTSNLEEIVNECRQEKKARNRHSVIKGKGVEFQLSEIGKTYIHINQYYISCARLNL